MAPKKTEVKKEHKKKGQQKNKQQKGGDVNPFNSKPGSQVIFNRPIRLSGSESGEIIDFQKRQNPIIHIVSAGSHGGVDSGNISSYLMRFIDKNNDDKSTRFISLDGGSPISGIWKYNEQYSQEIKPQDIDAFLLTHSHLDHTAGFIIMTPTLYDQRDGRQKNDKLKLITTQKIGQDLQKYIFNNTIWPRVLWWALDVRYIQNMVREDEDFENPKKAIQQNNDRIQQGQTPKVISIRNIEIRSLPINHGDYGLPVTTNVKNNSKNTRTNKCEDSILYIIQHKDSHQAVAYFGDVTNGPHERIVDSLPENRKQQLRDQGALARYQLDQVWDYLGNLNTQGMLSVLFIECAMVNAAQNLYGHLNARELRNEFEIWQQKSITPISDVQIIITHRKPTVMNDQEQIESIRAEVSESLKDLNFNEGQNLHFTNQGQSLYIDTSKVQGQKGYINYEKNIRYQPKNLQQSLPSFSKAIYQRR